ncbi:MAG: two-component system response regulator [Pirellulaceae bacterium]|nr:MAG: two-component system response regulator [Pirellulaceae bacterium]
MVILSQPTLLIADDDRAFRESLAEVFRRRGFTIHLAADGFEAIEMVLADSQLHLIMLDLNMPRLTGLEALGEIRQRVAVRLPAVLMSAELDDEVLRQVEFYQPTAVMEKPFTVRDITARVETMFHVYYGEGKGTTSLS